MKKIICVLLVLVIAIFSCGCGEDKKAQEEARQKEIDFISDANLLMTKMLVGCVYAEEACNSTMHVWHDAIYKEVNKDTFKYVYVDGDYVPFSEAIDNLYKSDGIKLLVDNIDKNKSEVDDLMKKIADPPEKYKTGYDTLTDYYKSYSGFMALAKQPSGSYNDYVEKFDKYEEETTAASDLAQVQIPKSYEIE